MYVKSNGGCEVEAGRLHKMASFSFGLGLYDSDNRFSPLIWDKLK